MDEATRILPRLAPGDAAIWLAWLTVVALLPGEALRRAAGLHAADRAQRWALSAVLGVLWASWTYWLLAVAGGQLAHPAVALLPGVAWLACQFPRVRLALELAPREASPAASRELAGVLGLALVAGFVVHYAASVHGAIVPDATGVRLYGPLYSDKLTNMSPCAALMRGVPPANLRMSGWPFPYHYFPHLLVAAASRTTGVDYTGGFWYYAAAVGIVVSGLAVLAFSRHAIGSGWLALVGLVYFGLTQFGPEARPLDLSLPLLLLGLVALDRYRREGQTRWAGLAIVFFASMPLYEAFHAMALLGGLTVWWLAAAWGAIRGRQRRRELLFRTLVAGTAAAGALLATRSLSLGARLVAPPKILLKNTYRESYRDEWLNSVRRAGDQPTWARTLLRWKRGKDPGPAGESDLPRDLRPRFFQRIVGQVVYEAGFVAYVTLRFVNVGLLGLIALALAWRSGAKGWGVIEQIAAAVAAVGLGLPLFFTWETAGEGNPNLYRLPGCAYLLLVLLGAAVLPRAVREWRRARWWVPLGLAAWQLYALVGAAIQSPDSFHHVSNDRLATLVFLRTAVPPGEIVIHPWVDDLIRNAAEPDRVAWVYRRHFTLGSNLAGQQMYYEGREDHLFIGGFVAPDEVYRRRELRTRFYKSPDAATLREVLDRGGVNWVVCDRDHPAPAEVQNEWRLVMERGSIRVYHTPRRARRTAVYPSIPLFPDNLVPAP